MDFEMGEREDFGDWGDERMLGSCQADWLDEADSMIDRFERGQEARRQRELEEIQLEFADEANDEQGHERDALDLVREYEESKNFEEDEEYLNCVWEE